MKLFGHDTSPYVRRVRALLAEMGLPFLRDPMSWAAPTEEFLTLNPIQKVPMLVDGDQVILDSRLIATYLYDKFPGPYPAPYPGPPLQLTLFHPDHRYDDENVLVTIDAALDSAINVFLLDLDGVTGSPYLARQIERVGRCLSTLDQRLGDGGSLHPGVLSFTDIALCCALGWMRFRKRHDISLYPNLLRLLDRFQDRPSLASTHPDKAKSTAPPKTPGR